MSNYQKQSIQTILKNQKWWEGCKITSTSGRSIFFLSWSSIMLFSLNWIFRRISTRTKHHDSSQTFSWFVLASLISRKWRNKPNLAHSLNHQQLIHWKSNVIWWGFKVLLQVVNSSVTIIFTHRKLYLLHTPTQKCIYQIGYSNVQNQQAGIKQIKSIWSTSFL